MPNDFLTPIQVGAGLMSRGLQMRAQRQEIEQANALFPLQKAQAEMGLQAKALEIQSNLIQKEIFLQNQQGAVELGNLLAESNFDDPDLRPKVMGLISRYPHIAQTKEFQYALEGFKIAENARADQKRAETQAEATKEAARIRGQFSLNAANIRADQQAKEYGEIIKEEILPGIYAVYRSGSPGLHIVDSTGKKKELTLSQKASIGQSLSRMKRDLGELNKSDPNYQKQVEFIKSLEDELHNQNTSPQLATPPSLPKNPKDPLGLFTK